MSPSFICQGGSLRYRTWPLTMEDAIHFRDLYREECDAAFKAMTGGISEDYERACNLLAEVVKAISDAKDWARCSGPARGLMPSSPSKDEN